MPSASSRNRPRLLAILLCLASLLGGPTVFTVYIGKVRSYNDQKGFGFIECSDTYAKYQRDVFLHREQASDLRVGDRVSFQVELNKKKQPQAREVDMLMGESEFEALGMDELSDVEVKERLSEIMRQLADDDEEEEAAAPDLPKDKEEEVEDDPWAAVSSEEDDPWAEVMKSDAAEDDPWADVEAEESDNSEPTVKVATDKEADDHHASGDEKKVERDATATAAGHEQKGAQEVEAARLGIHPSFVSVAGTMREKATALEQDLADMSTLAPQELKSKSVEFSRLSSILAVYDDLVAVVDSISEAESMVKSGGELAELAQEELAELRPRLPQLQEQVQLDMLPPDPKDDTTKAMLEIRPGVGGVEAGLWAEDLMNMYLKYCQMEGLDASVLDMDAKEGGGIVGATLEISGDEVWSKLKFESGVHRVQRVPKTEDVDRVQTSTATVALMPEIEETQVVIDEKDIEFKFMRAGGKGGQNVNKVETACHATHIPTGLTVTCRKERSQLMNKQLAIKWLAAKLQDQETEAQNAEIYAMRKAQVGSGGRTEKVRTYNYKGSRVSDHRLGENFPLEQVLGGNLADVVRLLRVLDQQERLEQMKSGL